MPKLPYRSGTTDLSDAELILLDVLFDVGVAFRFLGRETFEDYWNLPYSHDLDDDALRATLGRLCERGVLRAVPEGTAAVYWMTPYGGELWSSERRPIWERFARDQERTTRCGKRMLSVVSPSASTRDRFVETGHQAGLWRIDRARVRLHEIRHHALVPWLSFPRLYVAVAVGVWDDSSVNWRLYEQKRTWWRSVSELQTLLPGSP